MRSMRRMAWAAVLAVALPGLYGCTDRPGGGAAPLDPILAAPKVGDLYAAEISHFSGASYTDEDDKRGDEAAYGLLKVIEVTPDLVVAQSEMEAWDRPPGALNDLRGDQSDIEWDDEEKIRIYRKDLPSLVAKEKILEVRRPGAG